ncbi:hypothetical protein HPP92_006669 [Vanilla planifolia]|uniref:Uncharacterized protein n=1 Tax=Vanilla planifolia TaxID=51239 RepID=A0A835RCG4_VANPL|nr:hypothetical protein HPP92_006669 [Vanilla planifolia]
MSEAGSDGEDSFSPRPPLPCNSTVGLILRTSSANFARYNFFPIPATENTPQGANIASSLSAISHFHDITILDSAGTILLYEAYKSFPILFHVYDLLTSRHSNVCLPSLYAPVAAAALLSATAVDFKILLVRLTNYHDIYYDDPNERHPDPLIFKVFSSSNGQCSSVRASPAVFEAYSDDIYFSREPRRALRTKKPIHTGGKIYLELAGAFLICFDAETEEVDVIPKHTSWWEAVASKIDRRTKYGDCRRRLQCAKINPFFQRVEVFEWQEEEMPHWSLVSLGSLMIYGEENFNGMRVVGLHPELVGVVFLRCNDIIVVHDLRGRFEAAKVCGWSPECDDACMVPGASAVWEAAITGEVPKFCSLHAHENVDGQEAEVFAVRLPPVDEL